jgi:hypothetical protein
VQKEEQRDLLETELAEALARPMIEPGEVAWQGPDARRIHRLGERGRRVAHWRVLLECAHVGG